MSGRNTTALNFRLVLPKECSVKPKLAHLPSLQSDLRADYSHFKILGENPNENGHSPGSTRRSEAVMLATTLRTLSRRTLYSRTLSGRTFSSGTFLQLGPRARHRCSQVTGAVKSSCWQTTPACLQQDLPPTGHSPSSTRRSEAVMLATAIRTLPGHSSSSPGSPRASPAGLSPKLASHWWVQSRRHYSELCPGRANRWCNLVASAVRHRVLLILRFEDRNCSS